MEELGLGDDDLEGKMNSYITKTLFLLIDLPVLTAPKRNAGTTE